MAKLLDLTGSTFGNWRIESRAKNSANGGARWNCVCQCGRTKVLTTSALNSGRTKSCGCANLRENKTGDVFGDLTTIEYMGRYKGNPRWKCRCSCGNEILIYESSLKQSNNPNCGSPIHNKFLGKKYGKLTIYDTYINDGRKRKYLCICDCGNEVFSTISNLTSGNTKSCGCLAKETTAARNRTHGHSNERIYNIWSKMLSRCEKEYETSYHRYGGKGVSVCEEWKDFITFYDWSIKNGYSDDLTIDRVDNSGNYCPENCRWTSYKEQARNQSSNILVEYNGETKTLAEWAEIYSLPYKLVHLRYRRYNWNIEKTLKTPIRNKNKGGN